MGLQDVFFQLRLPFDAPEARALSQQHRRGDLLPRARRPRSSSRARRARTRRSPRRAPRAASCSSTRGASTPDDAARWDALRARIAQHGLRNSLLIAIAPTATIASIAGCYECIEPQVSNLFKRETLSGDFLQVNRYLVDELKALGLWNEAMRTRLKLAEGSVQGIDELPDERARRSTARPGRCRCAR